MAKRKVKKKAPKRKRKVAKRKVVKRKRKAPKRRRKRKFGSFIAKKLEAAKAKLAEGLNKAKTIFIKAGGIAILPLLATPKLKLFELPKTTQLKDEKKKIAEEILKELQKDCSKGDVDFKGTISYFKETVKGKGKEAEDKANELKGALYKMLNEKAIHEKAKLQWKIASEKALKQLPAPMRPVVTTQLKLTDYSKFTDLIKSTYESQTDATKKVAFNILGSLLTNTDADEGKVFKDGKDGKHGLINDLKAAGTAAIEAAKTEIDKKVSGEPKPPPAPEAKGEEKKEEPPKEDKPKTEFGKRKRGPSASLKKLCKKNGVRLMIKRGKKRVYKSSKVLKEQCKKELKKKLKKKLKNKLKNKLKKNKKKNFGKKKIKRSSIMPQAKRSYGRRKRSRGSSALNRAKAFAKKHRKKLGAVAGAAGLYGLGRGYDRFAPDTWVRPQSPLTYKDRGQTHLNPFTGRAGLWKKTGDKNDKGEDTYIFRPYLIGGIDTGKVRRPSSVWDLIPQPQKPWKFKPAAASEYGKRRRRRRKKRSFGKKAKKPSAALRRMCKKLKVKTTLKRGKKRVYKSETMLKKQCRKAKKRKAKK